MPLVLAYNESTESGHDYHDRVGTRYRFPSRYRKLVLPGEIALLYAGRRSPRLGGQPGYFGVTHVLDVTETDERSGPYKILSCRTGFTVLFEHPISIKSRTGEYYESRANGHRKPSLYFSSGVRKISASEVAIILSEAEPDHTQ